ncbi:MAG: ABC transporter ATP-binding protein, partial [Planctomycetia bacterium]|nr:ABC transporter ATP-binding protein [Planctomycetia bacterium]
AFRRYTGRLALLAGTSAVSAFCETLALVALAPLVKAIASPDGAFEARVPLLGDTVRLTVGTLLVFTCLAILGRLALQVAVAFLGAGLTTSYESNRRRELFGAFLDSDWAQQSREKGGHLNLLMVENVSRGTQALRSIAAGTVAAGNFLVLLGSAFFIDPLAALSLAGAALGLFILTRPISRLSRRMSQEKTQNNARFAAEVNQAVRVARDIRVFNATARVREIGAAVIEQVRRSRFHAQLSHGLLPALYQNAAGLIVVGGLAVVHYAGYGQLTQLATVAFLLIRALGYSQAFQNVHHQIAESGPFLEQIAAMEREYAATAVSDRGEKLPSVEKIAFEDVCFAYKPPELTLKHLTFEIPRGEVVGVAGPSASGKSTLIQLFLRLRRPQSGRILVNGRPLEDFALSSWFDRVAYVPQEPQLVSGTLADNIAFYRAGVARERIERAARMAGIHEEILGLPAGYDTDAGEAGSRLSGGQRQRVVIARALVGEPDLIIFDEPTSALDVHSEARIQETLSHLKGRVTLLIVAHRLSTLSICDRVMVLREGEIAGFGPGEELARTDAYYGDALRLARKGAS